MDIDKVAFPYWYDAEMPHIKLPEEAVAM